MRKRLLFVYNPNAGKKKIKTLLADIIAHFCDDDIEVIVSPTKKRGDATERIIEYEKDEECYIIACSGGDGTLHEAVNGMMRRENKVPIVYIPTGSTNDFGASLNIPKNMIEASKMAKYGTPFECDVASFNDEYFVYTACFGLFTETSYATPQNLKNVLGHFAYILNGATELKKIQKYEMTVEYDGKIVEGNFIFGMVSSSSSIGGFKGLSKDNVLFDDGYYELLLIRDGKLYELPALINDILRGSFTSENVIYDRVKNVRFISEGAVAWCLDGEYGGNIKTAEINVVHKGVTLMIPPTEPEEEA